MECIFLRGRIDKDGEKKLFIYRIHFTVKKKQKKDVSMKMMKEKPCLKNDLAQIIKRYWRFFFSFSISSIKIQRTKRNTGTKKKKHLQWIIPFPPPPSQNLRLTEEMKTDSEDVTEACGCILKQAGVRGHTRTHALSLSLRSSVGLLAAPPVPPLHPPHCLLAASQPL